MSLQTIKQYIQKNYNFDNKIIESYENLNKINIPGRIISFPYNLLEIEIYPTYQKLDLEYLEGKNIFQPKQKNKKNKQKNLGGLYYNMKEQNINPHLEYYDNENYEDIAEESTYCFLY